MSIDKSDITKGQIRSSDRYSPEVRSLVRDFSMGDKQLDKLKNCILENFPGEPSNMDETIIETAVRLLGGAHRNGSGQTSAQAQGLGGTVQVQAGQAPSQGECFQIDRDDLEDELSHTIDHLELACKKCGPVNCAVFEDEVDTLSKKIAQTVLNASPDNPLNKNYIATVHLLAVFNAIQTITTLLCADIVGGVEGRIARELVGSTIAGR